MHRLGFAGEGFCFDNELPGARRAAWRRFELQNRLVTNAEYLEFMEAGGYRDFRYWLGEGWDLAQAAGLGGPAVLGAAARASGTASRTTACSP